MELASTELNKPTAIGRVTKILRRMEGAVPEVCPDQAINGDRGRLLAEDRAKADAFVRTYAEVSRNVRLPKYDRQAKADIRRLPSARCRCGGHRTEQCKAFSAQELEDQMHTIKLKKLPGPD